MREDGRRVLRAAFAGLVLASALSRCLAGATGVRAYFPLAPGNYWIYRGTSRVGPGGGRPPIECELDVRVLVTGVRHLEDGVAVALLRRTSTPLRTGGQTEPFEPPSEVFAYFLDREKVYEIQGDAVGLLIGDGEREGMPLDEIRKLVADTTPAFVFPLRDGQRFSGPCGELRTDGDYQWMVTKGEPVTLLGRRYEDVYVLRYGSLPGTIEIGFIPGLGVVRDQYAHHGTIIEWDLRLVSYHLEGPAPARPDPGRGSAH